MNLAKQAGIADWNTHLLPLESTTQICFIHMFGFASPETRFGQYEKLYPGHKDEDSAGNRLRNNSDEADGPGTSSEMSLGRRSTDAFQRLLPVLIGMNVLLSAALLCVVIVVARRPAPQLRSDVQFVGQAEVPVEMELYRFATGVREKTAFWGAPNATTDAAWSTILDAGLVRLTPEQAAKLSAPTVKSRQDPTSYVGILEVFHQLHCVNILRHRLYNYDPEVQIGDAFHIGHCFEYLRQSVMCLADVNIAPINFNEKTHEYAIHWDTVRQCRNFGKIHRWAMDEAHHESEEV
ncbi:hypothetical protein F5B18DRAFT_669868 [Nemania serpens]|nr:hypothetical protein F5B18DRAFT_669868 [Nemania serpens]